MEKKHISRFLQPFYRLLFVAVALGAGACDEIDATMEDATPSPGFSRASKLATADFATGMTITSNQDTMVPALRNNALLQNNTDPGKSFFATPQHLVFMAVRLSNGCRDPKPGFSQNSDGSFRFELEDDFAGCLNNSKNIPKSPIFPGTPHYEKAFLSIFVDDLKVVAETSAPVSLPKAGLSAIKELQVSTPIQFTAKIIVHTRYTENTPASTTVDIERFIAISSTDDMDKPCQFADIVDQCSHRKRRILHDSGESMEQLKVFTFNQVTPSDIPGQTGPWYQTGSVDFVFNNLSGTLTYLDAATAPTYVAGEADVTFQGDLVIP